MTSGRGREGESAGAGYIVAASLGLLSLLIGFTLAMSVDRYEVRRRLVVEEAGAISTVWLRDQLFSEPFRSRLDGLLRDYVKERRTLSSFRAGDHPDRRTRRASRRPDPDSQAPFERVANTILNSPPLQ